ncbi:Hypothetical predicted protein [Lecanosticta acicola]|uniref:Complex 1 LYR protein domain-containing protein n=1 Tax=Lecanosticta acicola TaxID=111012 RepID=A0AAI8YWL1_9PEZI|nr:Hypothetical predicted protein [Lecanosticta acicola]
MPSPLAPHKSGVHRVAAIALFRALLQQCRAVKLPDQTKDDLQNVIRNRFKSQRHVTSHRQLKINFAAGYEAIDHLDAAVAGNEESQGYLISLLATAPESAKRTPRNKAWEKKERDDKRKERMRAAREERERNKLDLFSRPLPLEKLSGQRRKVPVLFGANHIPVLRLKKPQPQNLSAFLLSRINQRQRRHDRRLELIEALKIAKQENYWDMHVYNICGVESRRSSIETDDGPAKSAGEPRWTDTIVEGLIEVNDALDREKDKNRVMAEKMQRVVDRETKLARKENGNERDVQRVVDRETELARDVQRRWQLDRERQRQHPSNPDASDARSLASEVTDLVKSWSSR